MVHHPYWDWLGSVDGMWAGAGAVVVVDMGVVVVAVVVGVEYQVDVIHY